MSVSGWEQLLFVAAVTVVAASLLGRYLAATFRGTVLVGGTGSEGGGAAKKGAPGDRVFLPVERLVYRTLGVDPESSWTWRAYALAVLAFGVVSTLLLYAILRLQGVLPLNPTHTGGMSPLLSFNTAISFITGTNWQVYEGETQASYLAQMAGLVVAQFTAAGVGLAVALAVVRGIAGRARTIGNFWVDLTRSLVRVFVPLSVLSALVMVSQGAAGTRSILNPGLHGLTEVTYAYASVANNNGSAFAGLAANTPWYDTTLGLTMLIGRFAPIVLALAIAGSLAGARVHARTRATLDTAGPTFIGFLLGVIVIVGGLIYFPMLILGPIGERIIG